MESSYRVIIGALLLAIFSPGRLLGAAADVELDGIKKKIANEKKGLSQLQVQEGGLVKTLEKIDAELDRKSKELKAAEARHEAIIGEIARTEAELGNLRGSIAQRQDWLRRRAQALYRWQRGGNDFWIVDGASDLSAAQRRRRYLQATMDFDRGQLGDLQNESRRQEILRRQLTGQQARLAGQQKLLLSARAAVTQEAAKKSALLSALRQEKDRRLIALRDMEAAAQRLQKMLDDLARRAIAKPAPAPRVPSPSLGRGIEALQGQLDWPVSGPVSAPFGAVKHPEFATEVARKGIDIDAPPGTAVRAVEKGRVVYADRFAGYGRMVIVDHGQRYYTVYAHLSEIVKKNGDELGRGEVLGKVGASDSPASGKLYFELRKDGRSVDPQLWLRK